MGYLSTYKYEKLNTCCAPCIPLTATILCLCKHVGPNCVPGPFLIWHTVSLLEPLIWSSSSMTIMANMEPKGEPGPDETPPPFTVFSPAQKIAIACQTAFSATFSGLSSLIYYPAIRPFAHSLNVSVATINLTVSAYLIVAGIFPSITGDISDQSGRRVASLLAFTLYFSSNLGIALQNNYAALVVLRCLQSGGSAGAIAIAYGVVADITTPAERGSYVDILLGFTNAAPCLGPVVGGILVQEVSWRWIFWVLVILSGTHLLGLVMFFPETSRNSSGTALFDRGHGSIALCGKS